VSHSPEQARALLEDVIAHVLAGIIILGFFAIVLVALVGEVDINDPAVTGFVGVTLGYASAKTDPVLARYFRAAIKPEDGAEAPPGRGDDKEKK